MLEKVGKKPEKKNEKKPWKKSPEKDCRFQGSKDEVKDLMRKEGLYEKYE